MSAFLPPPASTPRRSRTAGCGCGDGWRIAPGRESRRRAPNKSRSPSGIDESAKSVGARGTHLQASPPGIARRKTRVNALVTRGSIRLRKMTAELALVAALTLVLAGCSSSILSGGATPAGLPGGVLQAQQQGQPQQPPTPTSPGHQRILAAYNGAYDDSKLQ